MTISTGSVSNKSSAKVRLSISDRNRMSSQLLAESLARNPQFEIVAIPGPEEVISSAWNRKPDLAVISADFDSGNKKGFQLARSLNARQPEIHIVMLLETGTRDSVIASFRCGARGVYCRTEPASDFRTCIERVSSGEIWAGKAETVFLLEAVRSSPSCDGIDSDRVTTLSNRELQVAEYAAQGQSNKQIAERLQLSEHTVKNYLFRVFEKLGVSNRFELLFLLYNARDGNPRADRLQAARITGSIEHYVKAAKEGFAAAQSVVGLAHLTGTGVERSAHAAYRWLRLAEESSSALQKRCLELAEELKSKLSPEEVQALERELSESQPERDQVREENTAELVKQHLESLRPAV